LIKKIDTLSNAVTLAKKPAKLLKPF